eukprot:6644444-Prymnesium_polylepis.2
MASEIEDGVIGADEPWHADRVALVRRDVLQEEDLEAKGAEGLRHEQPVAQSTREGAAPPADSVPVRDDEHPGRACRQAGSGDTEENTQLLQLWEAISDESCGPAVTQLDAQEDMLCSAHVGGSGGNGISEPSWKRLGGSGGGGEHVNLMLLKVVTHPAVTHRRPTVLGGPQDASGPGLPEFPT